jgi:hypothetical protein
VPAFGAEIGGEAGSVKGGSGVSSLAEADFARVVYRSTRRVGAVARTVDFRLI